MNDLFNLVYERRQFSETGFWGKYSKYNNQRTFSDDYLLTYQLTKLKIFEKNNKRFENVNAFLKQINQQSPDKLNTEIESKAEQYIYTRILEILNSGLISSNLNPKNTQMDRIGNKRYYKEGLNKETMHREGIALIQELEELSGLIQSTRTGSRVKRLQHALGGFGVSKKSFHDKFESYAQYKANEAEVLVVEALSQRSLGWKAIQSGQLFNQGQQLLEDAFVFGNIEQDISFGAGYNVTLKNQGKTISTKQITSLQEFFNLLDSTNTKVSISIPDELYEKLKEISLFTAQAKSGVGLQSLLNTTVERNAIKIYEIGEKQFLNDFIKLVKENWIDPNADSKTLASLSNFWLSKNIAKTNIAENEIYFTKDGFITARTWMKKHKQLLQFNPALLKMSNSYFISPHPYQFKTVKKKLDK